MQYNSQVNLVSIPIRNPDINKQVTELKIKLDSLRKVTPITEDIKKQISEIENKIKALTSK